jgi:uncharacterized cupin superfamily protein
MVRQIVRKTLNLYTRAVHGRNSQLSAAMLPSAQEPLEDAPILREWIEEGSPQASVRFLSSSGDGGMVTGVWHCTAGTFRWVFDCDEVIHVLDGGVEVEHEGVCIALGPGSVAFFPVGARTRWRVKAHVRKLFVHRHPAVIARKLLRAS